MLDNLRDQASATPFEEDDDMFGDLGEMGAQAQAPTPRRRGQFLGMNPQQRFIIAVMFMFMVCLLGIMGLLVTGKFMLY